MLVCTLGLSILHATRDLAVALVDVTQHLARLSEALATLARTASICATIRRQARSCAAGASVTFEKVSFSYPDGRKVFDDFSLHIEAGQRVGLVGQSGGGKSTLFALLQRFYDVQSGRILIGHQDIARVTQESLRRAIAVVPQDISLFHRSVMENIRYGRPDASDAEVLARHRGGQLLRVHRRSARRARDHRRRPRHQAVARTAPAHRALRARF